MATRASLVIMMIAGILACAPRQRNPSSPAPVVVPTIIRSFPHDSQAFTQGLVYAGGRLFESTGLYGQSSLRELDTLDGRVIRSQSVNSRFFAEGLALFSGRLYQLTWREEVALVYDSSTFEVIDTLRYSGEGWGLASGPGWLVMSNGSSNLTFRNPRFDITRTLSVTWNGRPLANLNELEYARGRIFANVWYNDFIYEIDPTSGVVTRVIDCSELVARSGASGDDAVLNGIAFNPEKGAFYLTGKNWPTMFEVTIPQ